MEARFEEEEEEEAAADAEIMHKHMAVRWSFCSWMRVARNHSRCRSDGEVLAPHLHKVYPRVTCALASSFSCQANGKVIVG